MANHDEKTKDVSHGNEWEVIPDVDECDSIIEEKTSSIDRAETSDVMYMSGHFLFPPSQHENLPLDPETDEDGGDTGTEPIQDYESKSYMEDEEILDIGESNISHLYHGIPIFDDHGNIVAVNGTELQGGLTKRDYNAVRNKPVQSESGADEDNTPITESTNFSDQRQDSFVPSTPMHEYDGSNIPCEAWWKKHAASMYAHAKESNAFWSIFIATTILGLGIIGQRWQQERFNNNEEKMSRLVRPLIRFKDLIVGGYQPGSFIKGSSSVEH